MKNKLEGQKKKISLPKELVNLGLMILLLVILSIMRPTTFATKDNLFGILRQVSIIGVVAVGMTMVITVGGIDLSVGYSLGLCGVILATMIDAGISPFISIITGMSASILIGLLNGLLVTKIGLQPFITTLGTGFIARGIMFVMTEGFPIYIDNPFILGIAQKYVGPVPVIVIIMLVAFAIGYYIMDHTGLGLRIKAIGGNKIATKLSGINVDKTIIGTYVMDGIFCAIAGVMMVGRLTAGNPNAGANFDMDTIAAAVVGGTSMAGGECTMIGTLLGACIMGLIKNGLVLVNVSMYWQQFAIGLIILVVCTLETLTKQRRKKL